MNGTFHSNGKLLLTGEYLVMDGASALALPLKVGQSMEVVKRCVNPKPIIRWKAFQSEKLWFEATFEYIGFAVLDTNDLQMANSLSEIFRAMDAIKPGVFSQECEWHFITRLEFDRQWGFGTSSTLIANLAQWAEIDPLRLHTLVSEGSGYDVAAALFNNPILFEIKDEQRQFTEVQFQPPFKNSLYFVYLGYKQNSKNEVIEYTKLKKPNPDLIRRVSEITRRVMHCTKLSDFEELMHLHEALLSKYLGRQPIKEYLFHDFEGAVKSLGAWGGDFVLMTWSGEKAALTEYLKSKGLSTFFAYNDLVLSANSIVLV